MTTADFTVPGTNVEHVLRECGISRFHKKAILVTGAAWTFVAMEILLVGFVAPTFTAIWHLDGRMQGLVNSAALAGSLCGSLVLGRLADRIGRRAIFQYAILWYAVFTAGTALAWGPWSVMTFRFLAGLGLGGLLVVDPSMLAEYLPPQRRGRLLVFLDFWWPVGLLLATFLSWIFIGHDVGGSNSWRWLFLARKSQRQLFEPPTSWPMKIQERKVASSSPTGHQKSRKTSSRPRRCGGRYSVSIDGSTTSIPPSPRPARKRNVITDHGPQASAVTAVKTAYQRIEYWNIHRRPKRSAARPTTSEPHSEP